MESHACAACGKSITEAALTQGTAVEHSGRIYCATCASLIVTPGSMPVVGEDAHDSQTEGQGFQVLQEYKVSYNAPDIPSPFAVVDEVNPTDGVAPDMAMQNDDDEWFKPRNGGSVGTADAGSAPRISVKPAAAAPAPVPVAPRPAAKSSGVSSRVGMKPATTGPAAPSTSGRVAPPSARMNAVPAAAASPKASSVLEPKKSGRISSVKPTAPLSKSSSRRGSAIRPPASVQTEAPAPEVAEVVDEPEQDVVAAPSSKGKSSRRMPAAKSSVSARATSSSRSSKRDEREEKDGKKDKDKKKGAKGGDMTMIYGGVAAVVVLIMIAVFATGRGNDDETGAKAVNKEEVDKTPSGQYASQAEKQLASGSRKEAMRLYTKASEQAEREGNSSKALNYNMKAMDLMKSSKLKDH